MDEATDPAIEQWKNRYREIEQEYQRELVCAGLEHQQRLIDAQTKFQDSVRLLYWQAIEDGVIQKGDVAPWNIYLTLEIK